MAGHSLYITTTDGVRHEVVNDANVYLRIDGDSYRLTRTWRPRTTGNAPIPEGFFGESGEPRGGHTREDFPKMSPEWRRINLVCALDGADVVLERKPVPKMREELIALYWCYKNTIMRGSGTLDAPESGSLRVDRAVPSGHDILKRNTGRPLRLKRED